MSRRPGHRQTCLKLLWNLLFLSGKKLRDCSATPQPIRSKSFPVNYSPITITSDANRNWSTDSDIKHTTEIPKCLTDYILWRLMFSGIWRGAVEIYWCLVNTCHLNINLKDSSPNLKIGAADCPKRYLVNFGTTQEHKFFTFVSVRI